MKSLIHLALSLPLLVLLTVSAAHATTCLSAARLTGVNIAGAEFNSKRLPGVIFKDYTYPKDSELAYIAAQGANVIRLPFRWERLQPEANKPLNEDELKRLKSTVNKAAAQRLCVILDVHNYAEYYGESFEEKPALEDAFVDLWKRIAAEFTDPNQTIFGLMNEPAHMPVKQWADLAKRTVKALRDADAPNRIFVGGGSWSGLHDWFKPKGDTTNAAEFADLKDPLKRTTLEVHQYADEWYSGTKTDCHPPDHFDPKFERISAWAAEHNQQ
ncbi:MAG TPA: glycoside hydrolase family 5 protein, partial [Cellvibrio sp.]|nr:glycoside hydrolase family 5 protein [Cellvibrio sp.]